MREGGAVRGEVFGLVLKCVGGLYTVRTDGGEEISCYARGLFRKDSFSPTAGDRVVLAEENGVWVLSEVRERKNSLVRPFVANIDRLVLVFSVREPGFNPLLLDKMLAIAEFNGIESAIVITKRDLRSAQDYVTAYAEIGYPAVAVDGRDEADVQRVWELFVPGVNLLCGNSGVGKTTLLNSLTGMAGQTGEISKKLGRGRHTTRQAELFLVREGVFIADTPGFSSLNIEGMRLDMEIYDLPRCFVEFSRLGKECRFADCLHAKEPGCAVLEALEDGRVRQSRYDSYLALMEEIRNIKKY